MMVRKSLSQVAVCLAGGLLVGLAGCGSNTIALGQNTTVGLRLVNALIAGPAGGIDVRASTFSSPVNLQGPLLPLVGNPGGIQPNTTGQVYYPIPGANNVAVNAYASGTTTNPVATNGNLNLPVNDLDTVCIVGVAGSTGNRTPQIIRFRDNPSADSSINLADANLKLVNLVPDSTSISLFSGTTAVPGITGLVYAATSNYQTVTAGTAYTLSIQDNAGHTLYTFPTTVEFGPQHSYTIFVTGQITPTAGGGPVSAVVAEDM